jgi:hypothetical protein
MITTITRLTRLLATLQFESWSRIPSLLVLIVCAGCASIQSGLESIGTKENYAKCAVADVASTALFLSTTHAAEWNPIVNAVKISALGHVGGVIVPAIGIAILVYHVLDWINNPVVTTAVTVATCGAAAHNLLREARWIHELKHERLIQQTLNSQSK